MFRLPGVVAGASSEFRGVGSAVADVLGPILRAQLVDFTGDGLSDLIFIRAAGELQFWPNNGTSKRQEWKKGFAVTTPRDGLLIDVATSDIDRDGLIDVLVLDENGVRFLKNVGNLSWPMFVAPENPERIINMVGLPSCSNAVLSGCPNSFLVADLFNKGFDEIFLRGERKIWYLARSGPKLASFSFVNDESVVNFLQPWGLERCSDSQSLNFIDYDKDADTDLLCVKQLNETHGTITYIRNEGYQRFVEITDTSHHLFAAPSQIFELGSDFSIQSPLQKSSASFIDLDNDDDLDMLLIGKDAGSSRDFNIRAYENLNGKFVQISQDEDPFRKLSSECDFITNLKSISSDRIYARCSDFSVVVLARNQTSVGRFGEFSVGKVIQMVEDSEIIVDFGDFDNDEDMDIVLTATKSGVSESSVHLYENIGNEMYSEVSLSLPVEIPQAEQVSIADLDGDGDLDIVTWSSSNGTFIPVVNTATDCASQCSGGRGQCASIENAGASDIYLLAQHGHEFADKASAAGTCVCSSQFQGVACEQCAPGRYGQNCASTCPARSTTSLQPGSFVFPLHPSVEECQCLSSFEMSSSHECTCPAGTSYNRSKIVCEPCPTGYFKPLLGFETCTACPEGMTTFSTGQTACEPEYCELGYERDPNTQDCVPCPRGFFRESLTAAACFPCPADRDSTASTGAISSEDCVAGIGFVVSENETFALSCDDFDKLRAGADCSKAGLAIEILPIKQHYWRIANTSLDVRACPEPAFCEPVASAKSSVKSTTRDPYCSPHHTGTLCASCDDGFALDGGAQCQACDSARTSQDMVKAVLWVLIVFLMTLAPAIFIIFMSCSKKRTVARSTGKRRCSPFAVVDCFASCDRAYGTSDSLWQRCLEASRWKWLIFLKFAQIVFEVGTIVGMISYGGTTSTVILNVNVGMLLHVFTMGCVAQVDHYAVVIAVTVWPMLCALALFATVLMCKFMGWSRDSARDLAVRVFTEVIVLMYPGISATILSVFVYDSISYYERDANGNPDPWPFRVLQRDPTIDFDSDISRAMRVYAGVMIGVYPVGVVLLLAAGIYMQRKSGQKNSEARGWRAMLMTAARCVQHKYRSGLGWYACLELIRRLMLTSGFLLTLLASFRVASNYLIASCVFFLCILLYFKPYARPDDECFEIISQVLLVALALGVNSLTGVSLITPSKTSPVVVWICSLELVAFVVATFVGSTLSGVRNQDDIDGNASDEEDAKKESRAVDNNPGATKTSSIELVLTGSSDNLPTIVPPNSPEARGAFVWEDQASEVVESSPGTAFSLSRT
ncbi:Signal peptide, CUB and EGF-like domain-containing protein 1 [Hondaea fermentalgiana]|uniref:Signal peptide, CUB and EGF-like domain-containing protein 1 n=1 Tax=Hondaea fermentalgiana TaxID=2315210 RepID=A0A2R5GXK7_9STRA|nr:Signal peptide, CUB and EGF-like domain-containing protein 1 [Hondaea fermentalgiana]|eukprot:GBG35059.1 Signal peptide, CUB and EGF-like domain-containing protein 1 [Hondaea fermentalgiana]